MTKSQEPTLREELNPVWIFQCKPEAFHEFNNSLCMGVFWLHGMMSLIGIHSVTFFLWWKHATTGNIGVHSLLIGFPLITIWATAIAADIVFRSQQPNLEQRRSFDAAVVNWFGFLSTICLYMGLGIFVLVKLTQFLFHFL